MKVDNAATSSFDTTADWAPPPDSRAAVDGDLLSRWSSAYTEGQWMVLDFGTPKTLNKIVIFWEAAYPVEYDILGSLDNRNWQVLSSLKSQDGKTDEITFKPAKVRYVKILSVKRFNPDWGISLWEVLCFGLAKDNPADKPLAEVYPQLAKELSGEEMQVKEVLEKPLLSPGKLSPEEFHKGVSYTSWSRNELGSSLSDRTLEYLKESGVRHVGIMVVWMQDEVDSKEIHRDPKDTPDDQALVHAINKAHALGLKVMLKPHVDVKTGQWRGDIIPSAEWFLSYKEYILYYAKLAAQYNVEIFSVGTELANTTALYCQKEWEGIIAEIKKVYSGSLVYSANWNEYMDIGFWHLLDYVGIDAYFALTNKKDPTKEELVAAWKSNAEEIDGWLKKNKITKPVVFTEVGYCSADGANIQPWTTLTNLPDAAIDQQEQADALDAMLVVCTKYPWFKGFYWWNFFPGERYSPLGYTIRGKIAEEIFFNWLKKL
ncbi:MAG: discoidin domain-containing protein [Candidatus Omnitrophota bacterium]